MLDGRVADTDLPSLPSGLRFLLGLLDNAFYPFSLLGPFYPRCCDVEHHSLILTTAQLFSECEKILSLAAILFRTHDTILRPMMYKRWDRVMFQAGKSFPARSS
jgi:hypothetical protein